MNCPICDSTMTFFGDDADNHSRCGNKCYCKEFHYGYTKIVIFNKEFFANYTYSSEKWEKFNKEILEEIDFWKENEKYLVKILENSDD